MTDKEKIRAEIERRYDKIITSPIGKDEQWEAIMGAKTATLHSLLSFIDSMQEEPKSHKPKITVGEATGKLKEMLEESVSEDLEQAIDTYLATYFGSEKEKQDWPFLKKMAIHFAEWQKQKDSIPVSEDLESFVRNYREKYWYPDDIDKFIGFAKQVANWQKQQDLKPDFRDALLYVAREEGVEIGKAEMRQQLMAKAVDAEVNVDAGGYPYVDRVIELYDYDNDMPLAKEGDKYKVVLIKED